MQQIDRNKLTALQNLYEMMKNHFDPGIALRQSSKLKLLLTIPRHERKDQHIREIGILVQKTKFLSRYCEKPYFYELCRNLYVKSYHQKQVIFKQGDEGTCFYVILTGVLKVLIDEPTQLAGYMKRREVAVLSKGDCFGEIALFFGSTRTATVISETECDLLMLERDVFQRFIQDDPEAINLSPSNLNDIRKFIQQLEQFLHFTSEEITQISTKCKKKFLNSQTIVHKQGIIPINLYIIRKGGVQVIQKLQNQLHVVDELDKGGIFGDEACLLKQPSKYTYITSIKTELILLNGFDLKQYIEKDRLQQYISSIRKYPEPETLVDMQEEQSQWQSYKKQLIQNIQNDKMNSRGFDNRMRLPELRYKLIDPPDFKVFQKTFVQHSSSPLSKGLFKREIESLRNQISPRRMKQFEQNYM